MQALLKYTGILLITIACKNSGGTNPANTENIAAGIAVDTVVPAPLPRPYGKLEYQKKELVVAAPGTKSVVFNSEGSRLYAMNLEGMSVYEFDQATRKIRREFKFHPTRGTGWDYNRSRPIASYQEKPVEACLSHDDRILWVSLHNAEGIVPIWVDDFSRNRKSDDPGQKTKPVTVLYPGSNQKDSFDVPLILTGKTPKVIARTADSRYLLVSNWHSRNNSILELDTAVYPYGRVIGTVPVSAIPRGIVVDDKNHKSYIAIMGGSSLVVVDNATWKTENILNVWSNPRHIVMDHSGRLFVSYNSLGTIACLDAASGKSLFTAKTHAQPRTIVLSKNNRFIFVTCYSSDMVDVFKINDDHFEKVASLPCGGHPVGVDIYEDDDKLEAWVCSYSNGAINVYTFIKKE